MDVLANRFEIGAALALTLDAAVLLKGVPTVIATPDGERLVSATGTPVLAAGGSGDILAGIIATLLAQTGAPAAAAASGAWVHGRAAELATAEGPVRGVGLDDVLSHIRDVWRFDRDAHVYPVLAALPAVNDTR